MTRRLIISLVALAALASIVAFVLRPRSRPPAPAAAVVRLEGVEFSGCASVLVGPVCEIDGETRLSLWVPGDPKLTAATDGSAAPLQDPGPWMAALRFASPFRAAATA